MTSIDPNSAMWGFLHGISECENEVRKLVKEEVRKFLRGSMVKDILIKPLKSEDGKLLINLKNVGDVTIGFNDVVDDPDYVFLKYIEVCVYEIFDRPIQKKISILGLFDIKRSVDKEEVFRTKLKCLKPNQSVTLKTDVIIDPGKRYKIAVVEWNKEYWMELSSREFKGSELDDTIKTLTIPISSRSYEIIEEFCKNKHISIDEFLRNIIENVAKRIQTQSSRH